MLRPHRNLTPHQKRMMPAEKVHQHDLASIVINARGELKSITDDRLDQIEADLDDVIDGKLNPIHDCIYDHTDEIIALEDKLTHVEENCRLNVNDLFAALEKLQKETAAYILATTPRPCPLNRLWIWLRNVYR